MKAGQYKTPKAVADQMARLLDVEPEHNVLDSSCGTGTLLKAVSDTYFDFPDVILTGVEIEMRLLNGWDDIQETLGDEFIVNSICGDSLLDPSFMEDDEDLESYDRIIINPPFKDQWGFRINHLHILKNYQYYLKPGGIMVVFVDKGLMPRDKSLPNKNWFLKSFPNCKAILPVETCLKDDECPEPGLILKIWKPK